MKHYVVLAARQENLVRRVGGFSNRKHAEWVREQLTSDSRVQGAVGIVEVEIYDDLSLFLAHKGSDPSKW